MTFPRIVLLKDGLSIIFAIHAPYFCCYLLLPSYCSSPIVHLLCLLSNAALFLLLIAFFLLLSMCDYLSFLYLPSLCLCFSSPASSNLLLSLCGYLGFLNLHSLCLCSASPDSSNLLLSLCDYLSFLNLHCLCLCFCQSC